MFLNENFEYFSWKRLQDTNLFLPLEKFKNIKDLFGVYYVDGHAAPHQTASIICYIKFWFETYHAGQLGDVGTDGRVMLEKWVL
jgi:hypothetical protein